MSDHGCDVCEKTAPFLFEYKELERAGTTPVFSRRRELCFPCYRNAVQRHLKELKERK